MIHYGVLIAVAMTLTYRHFLFNPNPRQAEGIYLQSGRITEIAQMNAHRYWTEHGYLRSHFLPHYGQPNVDPREIYTHYPPLPALTASVLLDLYGRHFTRGLDLVLTRFTLLLINTALAALALVLFAEFFSLPLWMAPVQSIFLGSLKGYWLYADNLGGFGTASSLVGLSLGLILCLPASRPFSLRSAGLFYAVGVFGTLWVSWDAAPVVWLSPLLLLVYPGEEDRKAAALRLLVISAGVSAVALALRLFQNSFVLGGIKGAALDWWHALLWRMADAGPMSPSPLFDWSFDFLFHRFLKAFLSNIVFMLEPAGLVAIGLFAPYAFWHDRPIFKLGMAILVLTLSWTFLMPQHSYFHGFTRRFIVWGAVFTVGWFLSRVAKGSWR